MPTGKLAKWQILLSEFDIVYVTQKAIKGQDVTDHLAENLVDKDYELLTTYFSDEEVYFAGEDIVESYPGWRMFFDGATNFKGVGIGGFLISESGQHYPVSTKIRFPCTNNMAEYEACILGIRMAVDMNIKEHLVRGDSDQGEWIHPDKNYIDPIEIEIRDQHAYCFYGDEEPDAYRLQMNGVVEAANKNIKRILRKIVDNHRQWHEKLSFALLSYHTTMRIYTGATPYMLVYGTEPMILAKLEIPSLRVIQEAKLDDAKWIQVRQEQLMLIDEKRIDAVCHGQLYQNRMANAFNQRVNPRQIIPGYLVLKNIFPHQE
ncbi:uncharacterized protein [Nicotiana tomentosiformis]|uniref:uncharacterized protein n=1 Tax=Nicotiana tomentosiformis TaxID=4098 RepID=UPI00388CE10F